MTASDTPAKSPELHGPDEYSNFVGRLLANKLHPQVVPFPLMIAILRRGQKHRRLLDAAKKGLFYGKTSGLLETELAALPHSFPRAEYPTKLVPLLHAILGLRTEVDELMDLLIDCLISGAVDLDPATNETIRAVSVDEGGDALFYLQALLNTVRSGLDEAVAGNVTKLKERFPKGYDNNRALRPDKVAERAAQAREG
jgi:hypothetical protein